MRLDIALSTQYGLTRNKARQLIEVGLVAVNTKIITKVASDVSEHDHISLTEDKRLYWVSRSAEKLHGFFMSVGSGGQEGISIFDTSCLDVGSSTGGFTQVLLEHGARHVDAVDVGTDQLHPSIRSDTRVTSYEQTDIRDFVSPDHIGAISSSSLEPKIYDIIVCDASFISLREIIGAILVHATPSTQIILLFKPQFEVDPQHLRKTGVPKEMRYVTDAMKIFESVLTDRGCKTLQKEKSTLIGEAGNQEWLYWIRKSY